MSDKESKEDKAIAKTNKAPRSVYYNEASKTITTFDDEGDDMPQYQGSHTEELMSKIKAKATPETKYINFPPETE